MFLRTQKGQSFLEYALLVSVVVAAIIAMQLYVKRGFQGGLKESADSLGEQIAAGTFKSSWTTDRYSRTQDTTNKDEAGNPVDGVSVSKLLDNETTKRSGSETIDAGNVSEYRK